MWHWVKWHWKAEQGNYSFKLRFHGFRVRILTYNPRWSDSSLGSEFCCTCFHYMSHNCKFLRYSQLILRLGNNFSHALLGKNVLGMVRSRHASIPDKVEVWILIFWDLLAPFWIKKHKKCYAFKHNLHLDLPAKYRARRVMWKEMCVSVLSVCSTELLSCTTASLHARSTVPCFFSVLHVSNSLSKVLPAPYGT